MRERYRFSRAWFCPIAASLCVWLPPRSFGKVRALRVFLPLQALGEVRGLDLEGLLV